MSKYTRKGSSELDARIDADLARIAECAAPHALAGILIGGYGRGEGTPFIHPDGTQAPFNDYDLVVVVERANEAVHTQFHVFEKQLTEQLGIAVDLCPYARDSLPRREFSLLNCEMKHGHKIVWGDPHVLDALPDYPLAAIPFSEGSRLLLNRGKLLLDVKRSLSRSEPLSNEERIRFIKFIFKVRLAFGDCALLAAGHYDIAYQVKNEQITKIGDCPGRDEVVEGYREAVALKDWGDFQALEDFDISTEFKKTTDLFLQFLPWYRELYSSQECSTPKAVALNLKWTKTFSIQHPRTQLYDAIMELLQDRSPMSHEQFYALQRRFS